MNINPSKPLYSILSYLVIISVLTYFLFYHAPWNMTNAFIGTYRCKNHSRISFVCNPLDNNTFYFLNYEQEIFIKGTFEKHSKDNDIYFLSSSKEDAMKSQYILCKNLSFQLVLKDEVLKFKKSNEAPIIPYNLDELLQ